MFFGGNVQEFLEYATKNFDDINALIELQCQRLSDTEKAIIDALVTENEDESISYGELKAKVKQPKLTDTLTSLIKRGFIERTENGFMLYKLVRLYIQKNIRN
jgi:DNA-binding MarR family transcriptional regulator